MALPHLNVNRFAENQPESADPFAMQLALSRVHARLVPMRRGDSGYEVDPGAEGWFQLPAGRGFAGYGLGRALRMLLDVLRGLTALHDTFDAAGETFAHGDVALSQFRVDHDGVCRLVPLTARHSSRVGSTFSPESLGHLAPERLLGEEVDARADVFSAGVLLWEALAGRRLFEEATSDAIIDRLMGERLAMPQLPPELAWAIPLKSVAARALAVDPYQRFSDCAELATAIAIVSRERVASHLEIANFFGAPPRSVERRVRDSSGRPGLEESTLSALLVPPSGSRSPSNEGSTVTAAPQQRPVPSQSATFATVDVPASSRRTSTLAPLGPLRSLTPVPASLRPAAVAARTAAHKSPFAALISVESRSPSQEPSDGSSRSETLTTLGAPASDCESVEAVPESTAAPKSSRRPPPLPAWAQVQSAPPPSTEKSTFSAVVSPLALPVAEPEVTTVADEVAEFRSSPARRVWTVVALGSLAAVLALVAVTRNGDAPSSVLRTSAVAAQPVLAATPAPEPVAAATPLTTPAPVAPKAVAKAASPAPSAPSTRDARPAAPHVAAGSSKAPAKKSDKPKDYGI